MSEPLRLMTFNVQLLPVIAGVAEGTVSVPAGIAALVPGGSTDAIARATAVAKDLRAIKPTERPHVIALNEVFSEDGRAVLLSRLKPLYPHVIESVHEGDLEEDAGLMVFSRIPFSPLPGGGTSRELFYSTDAGDDSWASKAAVMVRVNVPTEAVTLVFTHLQASYLSEDQHRQVRADQIRELVDWIDAMFNHDPGQWRSCIVAGDLNVRGDVGMDSDEWFDVFDRPGPFGDHFADSWIEMRPPGATEDQDPGFTHRVRATNARMRLDYTARVKPVDAAELVAHQMRIGHRDTSDHFALEGLFQLRDPHCQPSTATELDAVTPMAGGSGGPGSPATSRVRAVFMAITHPGSRHWIWIRAPGTYSFSPGTGLEYEVFSAEDLSHPLTRLDQLSVADLPPALQMPWQEFGERVAPRADTFVCRTPLLVAVRDRAMQPSSEPFLVVEHLGDSPATAIHLPPHLDVLAPFPSGQRLGADDVAWFRFSPAGTLMGAARTETVAVRTPSGTSGLRLLELSLAPVAPAASGSGKIASTVTVSGGESYYAQLRRGDDSEVGQVVRWHTPVTYLRLDKGFTIHVADETGPDWPGADEPELEMSMDGQPFATATWDDADTGEDWPGLVDVLGNAGSALGSPSRTSLAFAERLSLVIEEPDDLGAAHGVTSWDIQALAPSESAVRDRTLTVTVFDTLSDGTYTVSCTLSRDP